MMLRYLVGLACIMFAKFCNVPVRLSILADCLPKIIIISKLFHQMLQKKASLMIRQQLQRLVWPTFRLRGRRTILYGVGPWLIFILLFCSLD